MPVIGWPWTEPSITFATVEPGPSRERVGVEELLPHRAEVDEVLRVPEVLLRDLQLGHDRRLRHRAEQRVERLARLEVERAVLHLHDDVRAELAVERR